ncbi:hypothetical protein BDV10DRAFT_189375 [Aspergillus recurvatus]
MSNSPDAERLKGLYIAMSFPIPLLILSTGLRLWAELYWHRNRLAVDDILMIAATTITVGLCATTLLLIPGGHGRPIQTVHDQEFRAVMEVLYAISHLYAWASATSRLSVLALYHRAVPSTVFRKLNGAAAVLVTMWLVGVEVSLCLLCRPLQKFWVPTTPGVCSNTLAQAYIVSTLGLALDLSILLLPLPLVTEMRISRRQKILLGCLFSVGLAICAISAARIPFCVNFGDLNFSLKGVAFGALSIWECVGAVLCANLPVVYKPIANGVRRLLRIPSSHKHPSRLQGTRPQVLSRYRLQRLIGGKQKLHWETSKGDFYAQQVSYSEPMDVGGILLMEPRETITVNVSPDSPAATKGTGDTSSAIMSAP